MNDLSGPDSHVHLPGDQSNHTVGMDPGWYHPWKCACWIHELPKHIMYIHIEWQGLKLLQYKITKICILLDIQSTFQLFYNKYLM